MQNTNLKYENSLLPTTEMGMLLRALNMAEMLGVDTNALMDQVCGELEASIVPSVLEMMEGKTSEEIGQTVAEVVIEAFKEILRLERALQKALASAAVATGAVENTPEPASRCRCVKGHGC